MSDAFRKPVLSITLSAERNLGGTQVRVIDTGEIEQILSLVHKIGGVRFSRMNFDVQQAKVVSILLDQKDHSTKLTMVSGKLAVPGDETGLYYDSHNDVQSDLWRLVLKHLGEEEAQ